MRNKEEKIKRGKRDREALGAKAQIFNMLQFSSLFLTFLSDFDLGLRSDCQVWSMLKISAFALAAPPHRTCQLGIRFFISHVKIKIFSLFKDW